MRRLWAAAALLLVAAVAPGWQWPQDTGFDPPPVPADNAMSAAKVELGRRLFYDADLSSDGTLACSSCHEQRHGFADSVATRSGVGDHAGKRNAPGLANVAWLPRLTYADPGATSLEIQALTPLLGENPVEMGMKGREAELARRLKADACYRRSFAKAFPDSRITLPNIVAALAAFQRTMISSDAPYDRFRRGDAAALTGPQREGERLFRTSGCSSCHAGPHLTDAAYHRLGDPAPSDAGLVEQTGLEEDRGRFRTPSLRNVAITGPWWHDGTATSLEDAIRRHPIPLADRDIAALVAFLHGLTDERFRTDPRLARPDTACGKRL